MKLTFLGTGTSQGVPVIACDCKVCTSSDTKDKRFRSSVLIEINNKSIVIDTGPDFRSQMLANKVLRLDIVLFTHEHKDHVAGLDDIRPFNFKQHTPISVYASKQVEEAIKREYHYIFAEKKYPGIPEISLHRIDLNPFFISEDIQVIPIEVKHYLLPVFGFRIKNLTYITDAKSIDAREIKKIQGTEILVINALRIQSHPAHFNLDEALEFISLIQPKKAYLTHLSHLFGTHQEIQKMLPNNVFVSYDGLVIEC
ncbi:MAG: MBL fold metallo-hydrolase [Bacteroidetes bacterium]|nr:MBL fold metallo-hydrolase [Bacteroidota bacterium]